MATVKKDLAVARRERGTYRRRVKILEAECLHLQTALEAEEEAKNTDVDMVDLTEADGDITIREGGRGRPIVEGFVQHVRCLMATGVFVAVMQRTVIVECRVLFA
jgi:hypothetical protein